MTTIGGPDLAIQSYTIAWFSLQTHADDVIMTTIGGPDFAIQSYTIAWFSMQTHAEDVVMPAIGGPDHGIVIVVSYSLHPQAKDVHTALGGGEGRGRGKNKP